jgi:NitT/TauT family transport system substrate-binding protein
VEKPGIEKISDLMGKRVGLAKGTIAEFYLGRVLDLHGMKIKDVGLIDVAPSKSLDAVIANNVDAVVAWQPYAEQTERRFPNGTITWQVQSGQPVFGLIVAGNDWLAKHPQTIRRFWKALARAEGFLIRHPDEAKAIVQKRFNYDDAYVAAVWPGYQFSASLDESLILAMEDEARWMINSSVTMEKQVPDFLNYIHEDGLKEVRPDAVSIIR